MAQCFRCNGKGYSEGYACPGFRLIRNPCKTCGETGEVTYEQVEWYNTGEKMRGERLYHRFGQREVAKALGMKPIDYALMEQGDTEPMDIKEFRKVLASMPAKLRA